MRPRRAQLEPGAQAALGREPSLEERERDHREGQQEPAEDAERRRLEPAAEESRRESDPRERRHEPAEAEAKVVPEPERTDVGATARVPARASPPSRALAKAQRRFVRGRKKKESRPPRATGDSPVQGRRHRGRQPPPGERARCPRARIDQHGVPLEVEEDVGGQEDEEEPHDRSAEPRHATETGERAAEAPRPGHAALGLEEIAERQELHAGDRRERREHDDDRAQAEDGGECGRERPAHPGEKAGRPGRRIGDHRRLRSPLTGDPARRFHPGGGRPAPPGVAYSSMSRRFSFA